MTESKEQELRLSCCPRCGGEIQATVERYYSLRGGVWIGVRCLWATPASTA